MREVRYCEVAHFHFISLNPASCLYYKKSKKKPGIFRAFKHCVSTVISRIL